MRYGLLLLIGLQVAGVMLTGLGHPLDGWDGWVNWAMKARVIFAGNGLGPALYADASRIVTHLDYPLLVPLLQAFTYTWAGAADDRLAALPGIVFYLVMIGAMYAGARRWGVRPATALLPAAVLACLPILASLAATGMGDLPAAALVTVAAVYLVDWLRTGARGPLLAAGLAAGMLPWAKREGWVMLLALALAVALAAALAHRRPRRALAGAAILLGAAALLAGPWLAFTVLNNIPSPDYGPVSAAVLAANIGRLPFIGYHALLAWGGAGLGLVWPLALLAAACIRLGLAPRKIWLEPPDVLLLGTGLLFMTAMALTYLFSVYVPYQQHVVSSIDRLAAQTAPLPIIWLALQMRPQPPPGAAV